VAVTSKSRQYGEYRVEYSENPDIALLQKNWKKLEAQQESVFFLGWSWISCWLSTCQPEILLVTAYLDEAPVAMGLFTESCEVRHKLVTSKQLLLHQTGDPQRDQIWIEYNDFICTPEHRVAASNACLNVLHQDPKWDEIVISMMREARSAEISVENARLRETMNLPCFAVDLADLRKSRSDFLSSLSGNTRYQIRKSSRLLENEQGDLSIQLAGNLDEALAIFDEAGKYHVDRWHDSGYNNRHFVDFHHNLIKSTFENGGVDLIRVMAGETPIALLYNLLAGKKVYFYLQGVNYENNRDARPGLVAQSLVAEHYLEQGKDLYDLMGGYSQYKKQLAEPSDSLRSVVIQKPRLSFHLENLLRQVKHFSLH
jgi:CelD/BcsL family acetyltransferase involved in cellulose biosynthesis